MGRKKFSAAVDLGTNSFILTVVDEKGKLIFERLITVALGNEDEKMDIRIERARDALKFFVEKLRRMSIERIHIFGTQFFRKNPGLFELILQGVEGLKLDNAEFKILTEREEALFSYLSVKFDPDMYSIEAPLVVDIGGGSVETVFEVFGGVSSNIEYHSFEMGVWKLTNRFISDFPIGQKIRRKMREFVMEHLDEKLPKNRDLVGIGGTFVTLANMFLKKSPPFDSFDQLNNTRIPKMWLEKMNEKLFEFDLSKIEKIEGLPKDRAKIIPGGSLLVLTLLESFSKKDYFTVSSKGCRYSVAHFGFDLETPVRVLRTLQGGERST
ncbi:MAG: hypothetical protein J7K69_09585 [Thermotogae bacterium]|nr:hypothetical protein [Thermotogota bacterium]